MVIKSPQLTNKKGTMENINDEKIEKWIEDCPEHDTEILTTNEDGIVLVVRFNNQKTTKKKEL